MSEEKAADVGPSGIEVAYERIGDPQAPPVLLIMGAGAQLVAWPDGFCAALTDRGFQVIRFDNRDSGRSSHFPDGPVLDLQFPPGLWDELTSRIAELAQRTERAGAGHTGP